MTNNRKPTLIVIAGATGSGKTDLSIEIARHFGAPIISTDSRQFFRGMSVGTAQPSADQLASVQHYFVANKDITEHYTCGKYEQEAVALLDTLFENLPIVVAVGGSGLYIDALCNGMDDLPDIDPVLRADLSVRLAQSGLEPLQEQLRELDPAYYDRVDRSNPKRVIRALEVCLQTGKPYSELRSGQPKQRNFDVIKIGVAMDRDLLYDRINRRVDMMIEAGLEVEARVLYPHKDLNALQTVGYREMFDYFASKCSREEAIAMIKQNSRRYAKRQMTWFNRDTQITWFDPNDVCRIEKHIENLLNNRI